jgi:hypothetical protein
MQIKVAVTTMPHYPAIDLKSAVLVPFANGLGNCLPLNQTLPNCCIAKWNFKACATVQLADADSKFEGSGTAFDTSVTAPRTAIGRRDGECCNV